MWHTCWAEPGSRSSVSRSSKSRSSTYHCNPYHACLCLIQPTLLLAAKSFSLSLTPLLPLHCLYSGAWLWAGWWAALASAPAQSWSPCTLQRWPLHPTAGQWCRPTRWVEGSGLDVAANWHKFWFDCQRPQAGHGPLPDTLPESFKQHTLLHKARAPRMHLPLYRTKQLM